MQCGGFGTSPTSCSEYFPSLASDLLWADVYFFSLFYFPKIYCNILLLELPLFICFRSFASAKLFYTWVPTSTYLHTYIYIYIYMCPA